MNNQFAPQETKDAKPHGRKRAARWLFGLACAATFVALFYAVEDWRGKRTWENYKRQLIAQGEHFNLDYYLPKPVPDQDNFIKTPVLQRIGYRKTVNGTNAPFPNEPFLQACPSAANSIGDLAVGRRCNLQDQQDFLRGVTPKTSTYDQRQAKIAPPTNSLPPLPQSPEQDILSATAQYPEFAEIFHASHRRFSQFDTKIAWPDALIPNFVAIRTIAQAFTLRSVAQLHLGNSEAAKENAEVVKKLGDGLETSPVLVSAMIRVAIMGVFTHSFWEGWADHKWSADQLAGFQKDFESVNLMQAVDNSLHAECISLTSGMEQMDTAAIAALLRQEHGTASGWLIKTAPRGWICQNMYNYARTFRLIFTSDAANQIASPSRNGSAMQHIDLDLRHASPYNFLSRIGIPNFSKAFQVTARNQTYINEAALVCALERYHLAEGKYPEKLEDLAPRFIAKIPHDVINGGPLKYKPIANDRFTLYSIGWDEKDDGGSPPKTTKGVETGDWLWMYPVQ